MDWTLAIIALAIIAVLIVGIAVAWSLCRSAAKW